MKNLEKLQAVVPHVIKVAFFLIVSGGLTALLNGIAGLHLSPTMQLIVMAIVNMILAGIKKWQDA